ncbi:aminotransferase class IV [Paracoccus sp. (in: a-proteobacteria)]|uniref:aminotransferase class IV n=1 Tax=Paracoccus sp. TaxID=267 RepID=UPI00396C81F8
MQGRIPGPVPPGLTIFETMRVEADGRVLLWPRHLARLRQGCAAVGFPLDEGQVTDALARLPQGRVLRARLAVDSSGSITLTHADLPPNPPLWRVAISSYRLRPDDPWLSIKSSHRPVYDAARAEMVDDTDEMLLLNDQGFPCEGSISNLFVLRDGVLLTPPRDHGLLPGVLRADLLAQGRARETPLQIADLRNGFFCGNALRGLIPARLR